MTTAVAALAVLAAGCSSEDIAERVAEEAAEQLGDGQGEVNLDMDEEGGNITVETSEGTISMGGGGGLPESFPDDLPLPQGDYEVGGSMEQSNETDGASFTTTLMPTEAYDDLVAHFEAALPDAGWDVDDTQTVSMGEDVESTHYVVSNATMEGSVQIQRMEDETSIVYHMGASSGA